MNVAQNNPEHQKIPLYRNCQSSQFHKKKSHSGLWFERFFNGYTREADNWTIPSEAKKNFLRDAWGTVGHVCGDRNSLNLYNQRHKKLVNQLGGICRIYENDWNWVTGLGLPNPLENGFIWHSTLATPYLCGATIKGLLRFWMETEEKTDPVLINRWFGSDNQSPENQDKSQAGELIFFDAVPYEPVTVALDIMTPHMGNWYAKGNKASTNNPESVPADWHSPVPIPFLVVQKSKLLFSIAPKSGCEMDPVTIDHALEQALDKMGAGAKTAVGYGYMHPNRQCNERLDIEKTESKLTPLQKDMRKIQQMLESRISSGTAPTPGDELRQELNQLISLYRSNHVDWPLDDQKVLKQLVRECVKYWDPKGKNKKLNALKKSINDSLNCS